jgi:recombination protein RecR
MGGAEVERLIGLLAKLPGFGPRSARRAALKMLQHPEARMLPLAAAMQDAARSVRVCSTCGNLDSQDPCAICADFERDRTLICVVEGVGDLWALERAHVHRGLYHVLGGTLSALAGTRPEDLNVGSLLSRVSEGHNSDQERVAEVILALGATVDGATTAHWLTDRLRPFGVTVSRVGQGVPIGGALDVLDDGTLAAALRGRRPV